MFKQPVTKLLLFILIVLLGALVTMRKNFPTFPGDYPLIALPIENTLEYLDGSVEIRLAKESKLGRLVVFAYDQDNNYISILKPVEKGVVIVRKGDYADFTAHVEGSEIRDVVFLKKMDRYIRKIDMYDALINARDHDLRYGVQRCLYPICTRCVEACKSVISTYDIPIVMTVKPEGYILPVFSKGRCPRCGKCFIFCPTGSIVNPSDIKRQEGAITP